MLLDVAHEGAVELGATAVLVVKDMLVWLVTDALDGTDVLAELIVDVDFVLKDWHSPSKRSLMHYPLA